MGESWNSGALSSGQALEPLGAGAHLSSRLCLCFSVDQVREKKDVPLGPEDPKEEDGSFDYRCVISSFDYRCVIASFLFPWGWLSSPPRTAKIPELSTQ